MGIHQPKPEHAALYDAILASIAATAPNMDSLEILAILSQIVGKWVAFSDASLPDGMVMSVVVNNIELGNQQAVTAAITEQGGMN